MNNFVLHDKKKIHRWQFFRRSLENTVRNEYFSGISGRSIVFIKQKTNKKKTLTNDIVSDYQHLPFLCFSEQKGVKSHKVDSLTFKISAKKMYNE